MAAVEEATRVGIRAACIPGIRRISAGNYGGTLGQFKIHLHKVFLEAAAANRSLESWRDCMTTLTLKTQPAAPLEADCITPDRFLGKTAAEIASLPVVYGNQRRPLGDFFAVTVTARPRFCIEGDLARVKHIGVGMTQGQITVHGNVGMHLGAGMCGGEIIVHGNADDWAGAEMRGGQIHIMGMPDMG